MKIKNKILQIIISFWVVFSINVNAVEGSAHIDIEEMSIIEMQELMHKGVVTSKQLVEIYLHRIDKVDGKLNSILELNPDAIEIATLIKIAYGWEQASKARQKPKLLETYK